MTFGHFLVTRFNVSVPFGGRVNLDAGWLEHRQALFERFCLPAVTGQSTTAFRWLLLCDARTPEPHRSRLEGYQQVSKAEIVWVDDDVQKGLLGAVAARLGDRTHVITSRLDNDDAICRDYVERVQEAARPTAYEVLRFPRGYVWSRGRVYEVEDPDNPFQTLVEARESLRTVNFARHHELAALGPARSLGPKHAWLQVVHERNRFNGTRGLRIRADRWRRHDFDVEVAVAPRESALQIVGDRAYRAARAAYARWRAR